MNNLELIRPLVVIDVETTGLDRQEARIVEICMIKVLPDGNEQKLSFLINPEISIPPESTNIHGIRDEDVIGKPTLKEISKDIIQFMEGCDLCGFNFENFDLPVIGYELMRAGINWSRKDKHIVDVQRIFHKLEPRDLGAAYSKYCGKKLDAHRAENDARATIEILQAQLEKHSELPKDVPSLNEFVSPKNPLWIDSEGKFIWNNDNVILTVGKHKNRLLKDLVEKERDYLNWMLSPKADFSIEVKSIITAALDGKFPQLV